MYKLKCATHKKPSKTEHEEKGHEDNTDERKRQGQHKRQPQIWTDMEKTNKSVRIAPAKLLAKLTAAVRGPVFVCMTSVSSFLR